MYAVVVRLCVCPVPPEIIGHLSSSDVTVREGGSVRLTCNATGLPEPEVTWFRRSWPEAAQSQYTQGGPRKLGNRRIIVARGVRAMGGRSAMIYRN